MDGSADPEADYGFFLFIYFMSDILKTEMPVDIYYWADEKRLMWCYPDYTPERGEFLGTATLKQMHELIKIKNIENIEEAKKHYDERIN